MCLALALAMWGGVLPADDPVFATANRPLRLTAMVQPRAVPGSTSPSPHHRPRRVKHNLTNSNDDYGDPTCPMGGASPTNRSLNYICMNAPQVGLVAPRPRTLERGKCSGP